MAKGAGCLLGLAWSLLKLWLLLAFLPQLFALALVVGMVSGMFSGAVGGRGRSGSGFLTRRARRPRRAEGSHKARRDERW